MSRAAWLCALALITLAPAVAQADLISPDVESCEGKKAGASCQDRDTAGTCQESECCRLDYSTRVGDGPPQTVCKPCLKCLPKPEKVTPPAKPEPAPKVEPVPEPKPEPKKSGCATSAGSVGLTGLLSVLAGALLLLGLRRRA